jgi:hypothetical protein
VITRRRVGTVLTPDNSSTAGAEAIEDPQDTDAQSVPGDAVKPKSQVPVWRQQLACSALSVDYQRILTALAGRSRLGQGPMAQHGPQHLGRESPAAVDHRFGAGGAALVVAG